MSVSPLSLNTLCPVLDELCKEADSIAVAVSGGADSLCLTLLANQWAKKHHIPCIALTFDHKWRAESGKEALQVGQWLAAYGIEHHILTFQGTWPKTRKEERARQARYQALTDWCQQHNIGSLLVAHNKEDQAETLLLRLARGSGVDGLSAMSPISYKHHIRIVRPLLNFSHQQLCATLQQVFHQDWIEDPSNQDIQYERVRLRQAGKTLSDLGLIPHFIALSAKRLQRVRTCLDGLTKAFMTAHGRQHPAGFMRIDKPAFDDLPEEIRLRVLISAIEKVSGTQVGMEQAEKLLNNLNRRTTLGHCQIGIYQQGLYIAPELDKMSEEKRVLKNKPAVWNNFMVKSDQTVLVGPLGRRLKAKNMPAFVKETLPAVFSEQHKLLYVPHLDFYAENVHIKCTMTLRGNYEEN